MKLLLADDSHAFRQDFIRAFQEESYEILEADTGNAAISLMERNTPDAIVLDLFLNHTDAFSVLEYCQRRNLAVIVISAINHPAMLQEAYEYGADYCMLKPITMPLLQKRLQKALSRSMATQPTISEPESEVSEILSSLGIPPSVKGYHYLRDAILLALNDHSFINAITKKLYPTVAEHFDTTPTRVERAMRHAIEISWERGDIGVLNTYFKNTINHCRQKPKNSEFIAVIVDRILISRNRLSSSL